MDKEAAIARAGSMAFEGEGPEPVISFLRQAGLNEVDSILALRRAFAMSVPEAKEALMRNAGSPGEVDRLNQAAEQAEKLLAAEQNQS
jgi:hypothetical protein